MTRKTKRLILAGLDSGLIALAFISSYYFLYLYATVTLPIYFIVYCIVTFSYLVIGNKLRVFSRLNRYTNTREIFSLFVALTASSAIGFIVAVSHGGAVSRRIMILTYLFMILVVPASRIAWRFLMEHRAKKELIPEERKRTLVVGAGAGSNVLFKRLELEQDEYKILGIVDDDPNKVDTYLYGVKVLGSLKDIPQLVLKLEIEHIIVAIPTLPPKIFEEVLDVCNQLKISINSMPPIHDVLAKDFTTKKLRDVDVADLLGRDEVQLDMKALAHVLTEKVLLVTGAGGSIGSEICRQVSKFRPKKLILLGHGENSIYLIHRELTTKYGTDFEIIPVIADVQDRQKMFNVMKKYQPNIVYHAAAHKHVPLMEANPIESVKNNVYGTKNVAEAAKAASVGNFVMVSTDKAVNPPNVMGSTKRIAEMIVTGLNEEGCTKFCAVRFGNVLGSRGSVVPLFKDQIAHGGPVTVTDYRMTRYFMTIPEASRLVIQAGALADGGEIFILDMGEPVKILDLAKKVIKLSGFTEKQIPIMEAGIRPGEKLYEELLVTSEQTGKNVYDKIFVGKVTQMPIEEVMAFVESLEDNEDLRNQLVDFANHAHLKKENLKHEKNQENIKEKQLT